MLTEQTASASVAARDGGPHDPPRTVDNHEEISRLIGEAWEAYRRAWFQAWESRNTEALEQAATDFATEIEALETVFGKASVVSVRESILRGLPEAPVEGRASFEGSDR